MLPELHLGLKGLFLFLSDKRKRTLNVLQLLREYHVPRWLQHQRMLVA